MSSFKLLSSTKALDLVPVRKYKSDASGLTVIIAEVEGPVVNGFFCLATEAHDDDGLPHTLEHLIFLGSKRYAFKGILDLLANRCLAAGTNAWTDTDHTCYTVRTAGSEGMLTLLPIYLDHVLQPTLTDHGFVTEVHHIDGTGKDAGVVYCEMQGRENSAESRCQLALLRAVYPNNGYSAETGGLMQNLRTSTNNEKVRAYHKKFYRPENLTVILTGQVKPDDVFEALKQVEEDILAKGQPEPFERPWQMPVPEPNYGIIEVQWPADTEDCGMITFGWRGPSLKDNKSLKDLAACGVMLRYMAETPTAPLQRELVEKEDALAGDVHCNIIENYESLLCITVANVPIAKLQAATAEAKRVIRDLRNKIEPIDESRLQSLLRKQLQEIFAQLESEPHNAIAFSCIGDMLYSKSEKDFEERLNPQVTLRLLKDESFEYWQTLLERFFTEECVCVIGSPSNQLHAKMHLEDTDRINKQIEVLGEEGLEEKARILAEAMVFNEREPPEGVLASVKVPSCVGLQRHAVSTWSRKEGNPCPYFDINKLPLYARIHSLSTNFVYITIILETVHMEENQRQWLPLLLSAVMECPVKRGEQLIPHSDLLAELERHTVVHTANLGLQRHSRGDSTEAVADSTVRFSTGMFSTAASMFMQCEPSEYEKVVSLLWEILYATELNRDRLTVIAQRMINNVTRVRRRGHKMSHDVLRDLTYGTNSNVHWCSALRQLRFLTLLVERLNDGEASVQRVLQEAQRVRESLLSRAWLHLAADLPRQRLNTEPWQKFQTPDADAPVPEIIWDSDLLKDGVKGGSVVGVGGLESCFLVQSSPGPLGFDHPDLAALMVSLQYFTQLEGPMWRLLRGAGLAYSYNIFAKPHEGRLELSLYKSTNPIAAYAKAKRIIEDFLSGGDLEADLFQSAKSSLMFEIIDREKCPANVVFQSLLCYFKKVEDDHNGKLVCAIEEVTAEAARRAARCWLPNLFNGDAAVLSVVCHPTKVDEIGQAFKRMGYDLRTYVSLEDSHLNE